MSEPEKELVCQCKKGLRDRGNYIEGVSCDCAEFASHPDRKAGKVKDHHEFDYVELY